MSNIRLKEIVEVVVDNKENQHGDKRQTQQVLAQREKIAAEEQEKQIEEMAEFIHVDSSFPGFEEDAWQLAEELYKAGYRKHTKHVVP